MNKIMEQLKSFLLALFELEYEHLLYDGPIYEDSTETTAKV